MNGYGRYKCFDFIQFHRYLDQGEMFVLLDPEVVGECVVCDLGEGVFEMAGSITGGFVELFGKKNPSKGVKVTLADNDVKIDIFVVVKFGMKIPDIADEIQDKVKNEVEAMTGLNVVAVNVNVDGIRISSRISAEPEEEYDFEVEDDE